MVYNEIGHILRNEMKKGSKLNVEQNVFLDWIICIYNMKCMKDEAASTSACISKNITNYHQPSVGIGKQTEIHVTE